MHASCPILSTRQRTEVRRGKRRRQQPFSSSFSLGDKQPEAASEIQHRTRHPSLATCQGRGYEGKGFSTFKNISIGVTPSDWKVRAPGSVFLTCRGLSEKRVFLYIFAFVLFFLSSFRGCVASFMRPFSRGPISDVDFSQRLFVLCRCLLCHLPEVFCLFLLSLSRETLPTTQKKQRELEVAESRYFRS